jgi:hypothetical protein
MFFSLTVFDSAGTRVALLLSTTEARSPAWATRLGHGRASARSAARPGQRLGPVGGGSARSAAARLGRWLDRRRLGQWRLGRRRLRSTAGRAAGRAAGQAAGRGRSGGVSAAIVARPSGEGRTSDLGRWLGRTQRTFPESGAMRTASPSAAGAGPPAWPRVQLRTRPPESKRVGSHREVQRRSRVENSFRVQGQAKERARRRLLGRDVHAAHAAVHIVLPFCGRRPHASRGRRGTPSRADVRIPRPGQAERGRSTALAAAAIACSTRSACPTFSFAVQLL